MTSREQLLQYLPHLSDTRASSVLRAAMANYAAQKTSEPITTNSERSLCAGLLANLNDQYAHMVYVAAKTLHDIQTNKEGARASH